jgi:hypothetical protein
LGQCFAHPIKRLAIDTQDHIYVFNRGVKPVMVFDRDGGLPSGILQAR